MYFYYSKDLMEISRVFFPEIEAANVHLLRLDKLHPITGGNKSFKLKYNLKNAIKENWRGIISFGGAASNYLAALAQVAKENNLDSVGIIRGEELDEERFTQQFLKSCGMKLEFISRESYRLKNKSDEVKRLLKKYPDYYLVPEGGANLEGVLGAMEIMSLIPDEFECVFCACGTGTTLAGLVAGLKEHQQAIGISAVKGNHTLDEDIHRLLDELKNAYKVFTPYRNFKSIHEFHFGGFAKINTELIEFKNQFEFNNRITLDYIYTAKMLYALRQILKENSDYSNKKIIAIHTGGIQGNVSMERRYKIGG